MYNPDIRCNYCQGELYIERLRCRNCGISVEGNFKLSTFAGLTAEEQNFVFEFILSSGSLKEMEEKLKVFYPTVRNRLNQIIQKLSEHKVSRKVLRSKKERIIEMAEQGRISPDATREIIEDIL